MRGVFCLSDFKIQSGVAFGVMRGLLYTRQKSIERTAHATHWWWAVIIRALSIFAFDIPCCFLLPTPARVIPS